MINPNNPTKIGLIGLGIFVSSVLINGYFVRTEAIEKLLNKLK